MYQLDVFRPYCISFQMPHLLILLLVLCPVMAFASGTLDERALQVTAKRVGLSIDDVREAAGSGCDSGNTFSMNLCSEYLFMVAELRMNDLYEKARANVHRTKAAPLLVKSQRAWIFFRDTTCNYESQGYEGGTLRGSLNLRCKEALTTERISHINRYLSCTSPGCPGEW